MHLPARWRTVVCSATAALAAVALTAAPAAAQTARRRRVPDRPDRPAVRAMAGLRRLLPRAQRRLRGRRDLLAADGRRQRRRGQQPLRRRQAHRPPLAADARRRDGDHRARSASASSTSRCASSATSATTGTVAVEALYTKRGATHEDRRHASAPSSGTGAWAPSPILAMRVNLLAAAYGNAMPVSLRFTARTAARHRSTTSTSIRTARSSPDRPQPGGAPRARLRSSCRCPARPVNCAMS